MLRRSCNPRPNVYKWWRKLTDSVKDFTTVDARPPAEQPFGPDFGLTIFPEFLDFTDCQNIRAQYVDLYLRERSRDDDGVYESAQQSDGRLSLPPLHPSSFASIVRKLEEEQIVLPNYLNNQTINLYQEGDFIRAHVDNLFVYDETFAILSVGCPCLLKLTHIQNGEELECVIPERSVYIMEGPSRYVYFHAVLPLEAQRLSIVLRRCPFRTSATFGPVHEKCQDMLPYKGNAISQVLMQKEIGCTRISLTDEWMEEQRLGTFDTGEMVKRLRPLRDWSLKQQLDEDYLRYLELARMNALLGADLEWRFDELRKKFREIEGDITLNRESLNVPIAPKATTPGGGR